MRMVWLVVALLLSALLSALNWWAMIDFLYWKYLWLDIPMHFLGGFASAVFLIGLLYRRRPLLLAVAIVAIAVGWEVFEYVFRLPRDPNYAFDTLLDLVMDTIGAISAYVIARYTIWKKA